MLIHTSYATIAHYLTASLMNTTTSHSRLKVPVSLLHFQLIMAPIPAPANAIIAYADDHCYLPIPASFYKPIAAISLGADIRTTQLKQALAVDCPQDG